MEPGNENYLGCYSEHGVSGYGVAVKLSRKEAMNEVFLKQFAEDMMLAIAEKCMEMGARCICHIKSHIRTEAGNLKADTLGISHGAYSSGHLRHTVKELSMAINSITQGIPEDAVKAATLEGMYEVVEIRSLLMVKEKDHTYFDRFDFVKTVRDFTEESAMQFQADAPVTKAGED
ncbi:MAG: hypothetical protein ACOC0W_03785 [Desulfosalsimonas sp.]